MCLLAEQSASDKSSTFGISPGAKIKAASEGSRLPIGWYRVPHFMVVVIHPAMSAEITHWNSWTNAEGVPFAVLVLHRLLDGSEWIVVTFDPSTVVSSDDVLTRGDMLPFAGMGTVEDFHMFEEASRAERPFDGPSLELDAETISLRRLQVGVVDLLASSSRSHVFGAMASNVPSPFDLKFITTSFKSLPALEINGNLFRPLQPKFLPASATA